MTRKNILNKADQNSIALVISIIKNNGFLETSNKFNFSKISSENGIKDIIQIQWKSKKRGEPYEFTINYGVYVESSIKYYIIPDYTQSETVEDCIIHWRISRFDKQSYDRWWKLNEIHSDDLSQIDIWLKKSIQYSHSNLNSLIKIANYLIHNESKYASDYYPYSKIQKYCYALICYHQAKMPEQIDVTITEIESMMKGDVLEEVVISVIKKIKEAEIQ